MKRSPLLQSQSRSLTARSKQGFTLIELLVVIAIIMILAGITFGVSRGVYTAQARTKAKSELAAISQGLEQFKSVFGDYPITDNPADSDTRIKQANQRLVLSMRGEMVWRKNAQGVITGMQPRRDSADYGNESGGRLFLSEELFNATTTFDGIEQIQDPWGNAYIYDYTRLNPSWDNFGFILCSAGPDGRYQSSTANGLITDAIRNHPDNVDNIYLGE